METQPKARLAKEGLAAGNRGKAWHRQGGHQEVPQSSHSQGQHRLLLARLSRGGRKDVEEEFKRQRQEKE